MDTKSLTLEFHRFIVLYLAESPGVSAGLFTAKIVHGSSRQFWPVMIRFDLGKTRTIGCFESGNMTIQVSSKLPDVGATIFTVMTQLATEHDAINLSQGFPDFQCPERLRELFAVDYRARRAIFGATKLPIYK